MRVAVLVGHGLHQAGLFPPTAERREYTYLNLRIDYRALGILSAPS